MIPNKISRWTGLMMALVVVISSCVPEKENVDAIYYNATIYSVDKDFTVYSDAAVAIRDGKIVKVDSSHKILLAYDAEIKDDLNSRYIYPGFYDAHCHFVGYAESLLQVNLTGTNSFEEVLDKTIQFAEENPGLVWITGRGWDQNDWEVKQFPNNTLLDELFPDRPVLIRRVDGHAALANSKALALANITPETTIEGGMIEAEDGELTGILVDNAVDLVRQVVPELPVDVKSSALLEAQQNCFAVGLTTVDEAGLDVDEIMLIDSLQKAGSMALNVYAMLNPGAKEFEFAKENGYYQTDKLNVRSFKVYADGALGSRGACLKYPYSDKEGHQGFLLSSKDSLTTLAKKINEVDFQMNTHCIGDSANALLLSICGSYFEEGKDKRWRIEHAQVVAEEDMRKFSDYQVIPSVQPTHCTSDMYWAEERLGPERIKGAYAYQSLLDAYGKIAAGSDFPVEDINPLFGYYAAVSRKDQKNYPEGGFYKGEAISREDALRAMTIWAAYASFEEQQKGSIEPGKIANLTILNEDLMELPEEQLFKVQVFKTIVGGKSVYTRP